MVILEEETFEKFGYYPSELSPKSTKRILITCDKCDRIREREKVTASSLCASCAQRKRQQKSKYRELNDMVWLHKKYWVEKLSTHQIAQIIGCSQANVLWTLKKFNIKTRSISESERGDLNRNLGSRRSERAKQKMKDAWDPEKHVKHFPSHHTKPELIFERICKKHNLPFKYTGDGSFWIGKNPSINPDFVDINGKKVVVEIFGDYWHSPLLKKDIKYSQTFEGRNKKLKEYGWNLIVFWESDLKRKDAEAFILNAFKNIK